MPITQVLRTMGADAPDTSPPSQPCVLLVFGASGDLTKRLLVPALYNLACDGLLSDKFALLGTAMDPLTSGSFRERMSAGHPEVPHAARSSTRRPGRASSARFHYLQGGFGDAALFETLRTEVAALDAHYGCGGNVLFYFATAPRFFGQLCDSLAAAGFKDGPGLEAHHRREAVRRRTSSRRGS